MRKLIVLAFITLDGVMQEDPSDGFPYGEWSSANWEDDFLDPVMIDQMSRPYELVLGRKTYEKFAAYWPHQDPENHPLAGGLNTARKYVASTTVNQLDWQNSTFLQGDVAQAVQALKQQDGPDLHVHGSVNLIQTLLRHDLVDELWLKIFPITLGMGRRLFGEGTIPAAFTVRQVKISPHGIIVASYERAGEVQTGSMIAAGDET
jgi:dihydrofolate reductase